MKYLFAFHPLGLFLILILLSFHNLSFALEAEIHLSIENNHLIANYSFSEPIKEFIFLKSDLADRKLVFNGIPLNTDGAVEVNGTELQLSTHELSRASFLIQTGSLFSHNNGNTIIYSLLFEVSIAKKIDGNSDSIDTIRYYYKNELIHERTLKNNKSWERYLLLRSQDSSIETPYGELFIDSDLPHRDKYIKNIESALKYLTSKLGPPLEKPIVFFSYAENKEQKWWYDGRVLENSPIVQISLGGDLDPNDPAGNIILYHALFSHEIAHHWNAKNLGGDEAGYWIHEGGAEALAVLITEDLFSNELGNWLLYMKNNNLRQCAQPDEDFDFPYHCGFTIFNLVFSNSSTDPFLIMKELNRAPILTDEVVLDIFSYYVDRQVIEEIKKILDSQNSH